MEKLNLIENLEKLLSRYSNKNSKFEDVEPSEPEVTEPGQVGGGNEDEESLKDEKIKELEALVEELKAENESLKDELQDLKDELQALKVAQEATEEIKEEVEELKEDFASLLKSVAEGFNKIEELPAFESSRFTKSNPIKDLKELTGFQKYMYNINK